MEAFDYFTLLVLTPLAMMGLGWLPFWFFFSPKKERKIKTVFQVWGYCEFTAIVYLVFYVWL